MLGRLSQWADENPAAVGLAVVLFGLALGLREFSDPDIWFHLTIGRAIFSLGALPATEFYIFPAFSEPAHYPAAGYGLLQYLLFRVAGLPTLAAFNALLFLATIYLLYRAARTAAPAPGVLATLLTLSVVLWGLNPRFVFRPETILFLFLALELLLLERWLRTGRVRNLYMLAGLSWAITLLHTTWIILALPVAAYAVHWLAEFSNTSARSWRSDGMAFAHLVVAGVLMCLLPLLNPYGLAQLKVLLASFPGETSALVEYLPIHRTEYLPHFIFLSLCVIVGWGATRRIRTCDALMVAGFGVLAFLTARNIALFAIACFLPLSRSLNDILARNTIAPHPAIAAAIAATLTLTAIDSENNWGYGIQRDTMPEAGTQLIRTHLPPCNVFNFFHFGGYLAWELDVPFKVAIDGHFVTPTAANPLHDQFFRADPNWRAIARRYAVCAIVTPATLSYSGALIPLVQMLVGDPDWRLVAVEGAGLTFIRNDLAPHVEALPKRLIWEQAIREAAATLKVYPQQPQALEAQRIARERLTFE